MSSSSFFVSLWALGVIAFLFWFFRRWKVGFLLWLLGIVAFVASVALQLVLVDVPGYADFVVTLEPVGRDIAIVAVIVLVADMAVAIVYTIRRGKPDDWKGDVDSAHRGAFFQGPGSPLLTKRSKISTLYRAGEYVQMRSLVDGTATRGDWLVFVAVFIALAAFTLLFVGIALMLVGKLLFAAILPLGAGQVLFLNVRHALTRYGEAKRDLASRRRAT